MTTENVLRPLCAGLLLVGLTACSGQEAVSSSPSSPDSGAVAGGPPAGMYSCMHHYSLWNGSFYEFYSFHVDDLRILPGGRYLSNLSSEGGSYSYDAPTHTISYTGVYLEEGYTGLYEPAETRDDGRHHIENTAQVDREDFTADCLSE